MSANSKSNKNYNWITNNKSTTSTIFIDVVLLLGDYT